jgi:hypothetical protein
MERSSFEQVTYVKKDDVPYATFCKKTRTDSVRFFTAPLDDFQVGLVERPTGYQVKAHTHPRSSKVIDSVGEFLYLESGTIRVEVFDEEWMQLADEVLEAGDFVVLFRGGHSVTVISAARFIEVKQGPFPEHGLAKLFRDPEVLQIGSTEGD